MPRTLICCIFTAMLLSSCGFYEHRERQVLYTQIKLTNDSLDRLTKSWHEELDKAVRTKNFSGLQGNRIRVGQFLSRRRSLIANLELPPDAETLRGSEEVFLTNQAGVVSDVYPKFEMFNELTPDSSIHNRYQEAAKDLEMEISWNLTMKRALETFAVKNGIKNRR